jgi:hypothetical protein
MIHLAPIRVIQYQLQSTNLLPSKYSRKKVCIYGNVVCILHSLICLHSEESPQKVEAPNNGSGDLASEIKEKENGR